MSFKDLEEGKHPARVETPEEAELRARAAERHRAKQERTEAHRAGNREAKQGEGGKGAPHK